MPQRKIPPASMYGDPDDLEYGSLDGRRRRPPPMSMYGGEDGQRRGPDAAPGERFGEREHVDRENMMKGTPSKDRDRRPPPKRAATSSAMYTGGLQY